LSSSALDVVRIAFAGATFGSPQSVEPRIGVEVEFLALDSATNRVVALEDRLLPALEPLARAQGWSMVRTSKGVPRYELPGGASIAFEPGGQVELASAPSPSPAQVMTGLGQVLPVFCSALAQNGIRLVGAGIDPFNAIQDVPLQIEAERYRRMNDYFNTIGPAGARMMRQTASIQISVDAAGDRIRTWKVLNAMAPYLVAIFANSSRYAGAQTDQANYRSATWQMLDAKRTGIVWDENDPIAAYSRFALDAPAMLVRSRDGEYLPLRAWIERDAASDEFVATHLTTLFPEVRPRGYFEVRSVDALPAKWLPAPLLLVAGIVMNGEALAEADELLGQPDPALLRRAAESGLRDESLAVIASELAEIALRGCRRLGSRVDGDDLDVAREYFDTTVRERRNIDSASRTGTVPTAA
jgi:glutamate--cysteine ligase